MEMHRVTWERRHLAGTFERTIIKLCRQDAGAASKLPLGLSIFGCGFAALCRIAELYSAER